MKLLAEAEEEELLDDDDEVTEPRGRDVDPVVLDPVGLETDPGLENKFVRRKARQRETRTRIT